MLRAVLAAVLLLTGTALLAQAPSTEATPEKRERRFDCSRAKDPKACEERLAKAKAAHAKARQACEGKKGDEARECLRREMCAQTKDPGKCEARVAAIREACRDKQGQELKSCLREQRKKK